MPQPVEVLGKIEIAILPNGKPVFKLNCPLNMIMILGALEAVKLDIYGKIKKAEDEAAAKVIETPTPEQRSFLLAG